MSPARWRTRAALLVLAATLAGGAGCEDVEPAPDDLDGLFHYTWTKYGDGLDEELAGAIVNFDAAVDAANLDGVVDGSLSEFTRAEMDLVDMRDDADPAELAGMYLTNSLDCTLDQVEAIVTALEQDELYTGEYESYDRRYTSDADAFFAREDPQLSWDVDISAEFVAGALYSEFIHGGARHVPIVDGETSPHGPILLTRTWMPEPAVFENDDYYFTQDYQLEIYYEREPGRVIHLYGLWRHSGFIDLNTDDEFLVRQILNALADWDVRTVELCASGDFG